MPLQEMQWMNRKSMKQEIVLWTLRNNWKVIFYGNAFNFSVYQFYAVKTDHKISISHNFHFSAENEAINKLCKFLGINAET